MNGLTIGPAHAFRSAPVSDALCVVPGCAIAHWSMGPDVLDASPCPHGWTPRARPDSDTSAPVLTRTGPDGPTDASPQGDLQP
ncbi:hypothetical protein ACFWSF_26430 [Streptomyces sp. NPDC058611]|uniref:hypothetical protein n=1 Tax=unclassified Streptomyces TaxID=2593676 RepID=UPI003657DF19